VPLGRETNVPYRRIRSSRACWIQAQARAAGAAGRVLPRTGSSGAACARECSISAC
jgi:hypothetical protein